MTDDMLRLLDFKNISIKSFPVHLTDVLKK